MTYFFLGHSQELGRANGPKTAIVQEEFHRELAARGAGKRWATLELIMTESPRSDNLSLIETGS